MADAAPATDPRNKPQGKPPRGKPPADPQRLSVTPERLTALTHWLLTELQRAVDSRSRHLMEGGLVDLRHAMYEQAERPRGIKAWADAADLASWIPTEKVDSMEARLVEVVFGVDPICTVEGWGEGSDRIAKVEAFHQWQAENERLASWVVKAVHLSLIESNGILEVTERAGRRKTRGPFRAAAVTDEFGNAILDAAGNMTPKMAAGKFLPPQTAHEPQLDIQKESIDYISTGPQYDVVSLKDFLYLPSHAKNVHQVFGYAKRFFRTVDQLEHLADAGIYDATQVAALGVDSEQWQRQEQARQGITVTPTSGPKAEKELWECRVALDIDDDGVDEILVATVSLRQWQWLRWAFDDLGQSTIVDFCPFPRSDSVYGYSFLGDKLWTITEEHTATRNMKADRQALALNAPIMKLSTSTWSPTDEPWGPAAIITVRSFNELQVMPIPDVPASTIQNEQTILGAAERLSGESDLAVSGVTPIGQRSATEAATTAQASYVRVRKPLRHIQEAMEDLYQLRQRLWERALASHPDGVVAPAGLVANLERRGVKIPSLGPFKFTAADIQGNWRFKPYGSVDTADFGHMLQNYNTFMGQALPALMKVFPNLAQQLTGNPDAGLELFEQALRLFRVPNAATILKTPKPVAAPGAGTAAVPGQPLPGAAPAPGLPAAPAAVPTPAELEGVGLPGLLSAVGTPSGPA